jgi:NADPH:quinone reductase
VSVPASHRAAVLTAPRQTKVADADIPRPVRGEVRVRLEGCGICASNLAVWEGRPWFDYPRPPGSPGHEGWGRVDALGSGVSDLEIGQRVALISGAAYAEYDIAPRAGVVRLPPELDAEPFPGEPLGCVMNVFERSDVGRGQCIAIVGAGFMGLLLAQLCARAGAYVLVLSRRAYALQLSRKMGAHETLQISDGDDRRQAALQLSSGRGYDRVIEVAGVQSTLDLASALVAERGRLVIAGYHQDGKREVDMQQWNWRGIDVINAHERSVQRYAMGIKRAIAAVLEERMNPFPLLTHSFGMDALDGAFDMMRTRPDGFIKAVLRTGAR